ncbi:unnamed protein product [Penicillium manginii]
MNPLKITLAGNARVSRQPERGILNFYVFNEGEDREDVIEKVTETSNEISNVFKQLSPKDEAGNTVADAPVAVFSATSLRTWSDPNTRKEAMRDAVVAVAIYDGEGRVSGLQQYMQSIAGAFGGRSRYAAWSVYQTSGLESAID